MRNGIRLASVLLALFFLAACGRAENAPELLEPVIVRSDLAKAEIGNMYDGSVIEGNILPKVEELAFSVDGRIGEINVIMGETVSKGDPLIRLDTEALEKRQKTLKEQLEYAVKMDEFDSRAAEINAELIGLQSGYGSTGYQLFVNQQNEAAQARQAEIASLKKQLAEIEEDLNFESVIYAPFDGTVASVNVNVRDMVREDDVVVVVVNNDVCLLQTEFIPASSVDRAVVVYAMTEGERYDVDYIPTDIADYIEKSLAGQAVFSYFEIVGGKSDLIGQYALLYLMSAQREQVLNIPVNALQKADGNYFVYVDRNGERVRQEVTIGLKTSAQAEILSGLQEGESVYVVG